MYWNLIKYLEINPCINNNCTNLQRKIQETRSYHSSGGSCFFVMVLPLLKELFFYDGLTSTEGVVFYDGLTSTYASSSFIISEVTIETSFFVTFRSIVTHVTLLSSTHKATITSIFHSVYTGSTLGCVWVHTLTWIITFTWNLKKW